MLISVYCIGCKNAKKKESVNSAEVENQNTLQETEISRLNQSNIPAANPLPSNDLSKTLKKNIPTFEEQIKRIEAQAVEFETTHNLPLVAAEIRDKVSKTQRDNPQSITKLAGYVRVPPHADKWNDNIGCSFDLMRLAIADDDKKAMVIFFESYWNKKYIPAQYVDESFEIVRSYAASGNSRAIIALACTRIYSNSNRPNYDEENLKKEFPNESNPGLTATITMLEQALETELDVPQKEMRRQMTGLLSTAYAYSGNKQKAQEILDETGTSPDPHLEKILARDKLKKREDDSAVLAGATEKMSIDEFGDIDLYSAVWNKPRPEPTLERSKTIVSWHETNILLPYKAEKMTKDELVKKIKNEPVMLLYPKKNPELRYWITLGDKPPIVLVENTAKKETQTYSIPHDKEFDLTFISVVPADKKK